MTDQIQETTGVPVASEQPSDPTAIEGTWSDLERHARYIYWLESATKSEHDLAEAVLVLLGSPA